MPNNNDLSLFTITHPDTVLVDNGLVELGDPGVMANVDCHRILIMDEATLHRRQAELEGDWYHWRTKMHPVQQ